MVNSAGNGIATHLVGVDAFGFSVPGPETFEAGAKYLLSRGYR